jgi:inorganic pyrophosphatase/exopolyphosphatase
MTVREAVPLLPDRFGPDDIASLMADYTAVMGTDNETMAALKNYFTGSPHRHGLKKLSFSSATKYSGVTFSHEGTYLLGAPEKILLGEYDTFRGEIEKYSTSRMVELLDIELKNIREIPEMAENDYIVLVDSQKGNANITDFIGNEIASIDHHPIFHKIDYLFQDIRPHVGACSSIITEYFIENDVELPSSIATALIYGLKTDTLELSRGVSDLDLDMFYKLYKTADIEL